MVPKCVAYKEKLKIKSCNCQAHEMAHSHDSSILSLSLSWNFTITYITHRPGFVRVRQGNITQYISTLESW